MVMFCYILEQAYMKCIPFHIGRICYNSFSGIAIVYCPLLLSL